MSYAERSLKLHYELRGKLETAIRTEVNDRDSLSLAYTPGVAQPCLEIQKDVEKSYELTRRWNTVAVVTDGSAVLGLLNALKLVKKEITQIRMVINGAGAAVVATGRSDYPNQINNVLCFPGIFRGTLDVRARRISHGMKIAAAYALANLVSDEELTCDNILPQAFDSRIKDAVSKAVAACAVEEGLAGI